MSDNYSVQSILSIIKSRIPNYITEEYEEFTNFIIDYYKYLEEESFIKELNLYRDNLYQNIGKNDFINKKLRSLGFDVNIDVENNTIDYKLVYFLVNQFFDMRGTIPSFKLLFKILFNDDVDIIYPRDRMLYASAARYVKKQYMIFTWNNFKDIPADLPFCGIKGLLSNSVAGIESITPIYFNNNKYMLIEISGATDKFLLDEPVNIITIDATYTEVNSGITSIKITNPGYNYTIGDVITVENCGFQGTCAVKSLVKGKIQSINIINAGYGYEIGDAVLTNPNNGFFALITDVDDFGRILDVEVKNMGRDYIKIPDCNIVSKNGYDAELEFISSNIGGVRDVDYIIPYALCGNNDINITSLTGTGFTAEVERISYIEISSYDDHKGFIRLNSGIIQDSNSVHEFAYDIQTNVNSNRYASVVDNFLHPVGFKVNYVKLLNITANIKTNIVSSEVYIEHAPKIVTEIYFESYIPPYQFAYRFLYKKPFKFEFTFKINNTFVYEQHSINTRVFKYNIESDSELGIDDSEFYIETEPKD